MVRRSASGVSGASCASTCLSTGALSPVRAASAVRRRLPRMSRASAGTWPPASRISRSPGTTSAAGIRARFPSRRTRACGTARARSFASEIRARHSVTNPIAALRRSAARIARASTCWPSEAAMAEAARRSRTTRLRNCARTRRQRGGSECSPTVFGPTRASRRCASSALSPAAGSTPRSFRTSPGERACHSRLTGGPPSATASPWADESGDHGSWNLGFRGSSRVPCIKTAQVPLFHIAVPARPFSET